MRTYDIIAKKRDGHPLTTGEIDFIIHGYATGQIPDYQMAAWLMAVFLNDMNRRETMDLTVSMMRSGRVIDLGNVPGIPVDKHSTGGVGDKVSLILAPLVAAAGVPVPMLSGRGLGHTGGTLDKLESIPGFRTDLSIDEFKQNVAEIGVAIMGQTDSIAPADGKIYALRDVTATVESLPLIVSSILSKKLAAGPRAIVFDVKVGRGGIMKHLQDAQRLAERLIDIAGEMGRDAIALLTNMDQPLGRMVGNSLEVMESIEALQGKGPTDLMEVTLALGAQMLVLGGRVATPGEGEDLMRETIANGKGIQKFAELVDRQGGDVRIIDDTSLLPRAATPLEVTSSRAGYIRAIDAKAIGVSSVALGAGREKLYGQVQHGVGIWIRRAVGDQVSIGEPLAIVYANDETRGNEGVLRIHDAFHIEDEPCGPPTMIHNVISPRKRRK